MSMLSRADGKPTPEAAALIRQMLTFAIQPPSDDQEANIQRVRDLHHILDGAKDALDAGMAVVNDAPYGKKVSYRRVESELGWDKLTARKYVLRGKAVLESLKVPALRK